MAAAVLAERRHARLHRVGFVDVEGFITELYKGNMRMAQKLIARINQKAHFVKNEERPEVAEMIKLIIKCMGEKYGADVFH